jgi:hypothetical protein
MGTKCWDKIYIEQDPDPVFFRDRIQIQSRLDQQNYLLNMMKVSS